MTSSPLEVRHDALLRPQTTAGPSDTIWLVFMVWSESSDSTATFFYSGLMWVTRKQHRPEYGWTEGSTEPQGGLEDTNTQGRALHRTGSFGLAGSSDSVNSTGSCSTFVAEVTQFGWNTHTNPHTTRSMLAQFSLQSTASRTYYHHITSVK